MAATTTPAHTEPTQNGEGGQEAESSAAGAAAAAAAVFKRLHPSSYLAKFLAQGYRPDGRKVRGWRDVSINVGSISTANGSALVRMGETTMVCGIKAETAEPKSENPTHGYVVPNIDLPALCSPRFKPGPPGDEAQVYSSWLNDLIVSCRTVPPASLCISPGKAVWVLYIDIVCINYDGNAFDAAVLAVMAALRNTRLPRATYDPITGKVTCERDETYPLTLGRMPLSCTFGVFQSSHLLPDPTAFETPLLPTNLVIALDEVNIAASVRHEGIGGIVGRSGEKVVSDAWALAEERVHELRAVLAEANAEGS